MNRNILLILAVVVFASVAAVFTFADKEHVCIHDSHADVTEAAMSDCCPNEAMHGAMHSDHGESMENCPMHSGHGESMENCPMHNEVKETSEMNCPLHGGVQGHTNDHN